MTARDLQELGEWAKRQMTIVALKRSAGAAMALERARQAGLRVWLNPDGSGIRWRGPQPADQLLLDLIQYKAELLVILRFAGEL